MEKLIMESNELLFFLTTMGDIDRVLEIEQHEENSKFVFNWSKDAHIKAVEDSNWLHITIKRREDSVIVGYIILRGMENDDDSLELTRIVISDKGKGYGRESIRFVKNLCFDEMGCHRLWLDVFDYNIAAMELYKAEGFVEEGTLRECKKVDGKYYSMKVFSILSNEYFVR